MQTINFGDFIVELSTTNPALRIRRKGADSSGIFLDVDTDGNITFWNGNDYKKVNMRDGIAQYSFQINAASNTDLSGTFLTMYVFGSKLKFTSQDSNQETIRLVWDFENKILSTEPLRTQFIIQGCDSNSSPVNFIIDFNAQSTSFQSVHLNP